MDVASAIQTAPIDDGVLVERIRRGDERAFATLYRRHARYIAGLAHRLLADPAEVDDVVQEAFIRAAQSIDGLRDPDHVRAWLATIAVRCARRRLGRSLFRRQLGEELRLVAPRGSDPRSTDEVEELYRALDALPGRLRVPWILHRIERATLPETAALCETSLSTVKRRIAAAESRLKRKLDAG